MKKSPQHQTASLVVAMLAIGIAHAQIKPKPPGVTDYLYKDGRFQIFSRMLRLSGLEETLKSSNLGRGFTLLAPTDDAFAKVPTAVLDVLNTKFEARREFLAYHILLSKQTAADLALEPKTLQGERLSFKTGLPPVTAHIMSPDISMRNGNVQILDRVLFPPELIDILQHEGAVAIAVGVKSDPTGSVRTGRQGPITNSSVPAIQRSANRQHRIRGHWRKTLR